ncbi:methylthioribose-1-phosphate isomerase [Methanolinea mesophila]|uniref:S-methyl-5-thioribose-1-phosphate isomerase n=1 Tax=Methanolinea mesophila TaxID=547055 RepID=UPI001AE60D63|nr:S-methyl-5-thioribose-1-phosphate isomerase [Methanolinea mesophila]MBP1927490.1 methylthioribose-1-phosphate isomerase [Methanolinea mesophila]
MKTVETISWDEADQAVHLIDQTRLPGAYRNVRCASVDRLVRAIQRLEVRGAPALGVAGALGVALAARKIPDKDFRNFSEKLSADAERLRNARPTAVNLSWGVDRVMAKAGKGLSVKEVRELTLSEALAVAEEDARSCHALGAAGAAILPDQCTVLTHCNAGALACKEWGTALGVVRSAVEAGKKVRVIACETRPLLQGARLTAWELQRDGIDVTVVPDSSAAYLMRLGMIDVVVVGADRVTRDVVFNKIGTYMHAICAMHHKIPFYVAAPLSTFDPDRTEREVEVEQRGRDEVATFGGVETVPHGVPVLNYGFDATPLSLVRGIVTEIGVLAPPLDWDLVVKERERHSP